VPYFDDEDRMRKIPLYDPLAYGRPVPQDGVFEGDLITLCINRDWARKHLATVAYRLTWDDAWDGTQSERMNAVSEARRLFLALTTGNSCTSLGDNTLLRQNPDDPCELQQSQDNGTTWTLAFDYSLCVKPQPIRQDYSLFNQLLNEFELLKQAFDNTVSSVAPDMVYDGSTNDDFRDLALCQACHNLVNDLCELEIQHRANIGVAGGAFGLTAGIMALVGIGLSITTAPFVVGLTSLGALGGALGLFDTVSNDILNDTEGRKKVACCMYNSLKGATMTQSGFESSLSGCSFDPISAESQISGSIESLLTGQNIYPLFLDFVQRFYRYAELGIAECGCVDNSNIEWSHIFDFTISDGGFYPQNNGSIDRSVYVAGSGWESVPQSNVNGEVNVILRDITTPTTITSMSYSVTGTASFRISFYLPYGQDVLATDPDTIRDVNWVMDGTSGIGIEYSAGGYDTVITSITVTGTGTNPFI